MLRIRVLNCLRFNALPQVDLCCLLSWLNIILIYVNLLNGLLLLTFVKVLID